MMQESRECEPLAGSLEEASCVMVAGRGLKSKKGFERLVYLGGITGAQVGATRGAVEEGWISVEREIGLSGKRIHPRLYVGFGVSGADFHMIGIEDTELLVAVNKDRKALIFDYADVRITGDAEAYLEKVIEDCRSCLEGKNTEEKTAVLMKYFMHQPGGI